MTLWYRFGMGIIRLNDWILWKIFPKIQYDFYYEVAGQMDDFIHIDQVGEALAEMRER